MVFAGKSVRNRGRNLRFLSRPAFSCLSSGLAPRPDPVANSWPELVRACRPPLLLLLMICQSLCCASSASLPKRLILALDGISFRDMKDLQEGMVCEDSRGAQVYRRAFYQGYFPVSCLVSTFPSASDVAWTEIFGNRPLPGYQRTYFSRRANTSIFVNGVSSSMEFERQMTWRMESGFGHAMGYLFPERVFKCEVANLIAHFLAASNVVDNYYGYILSIDCAQHMACNVFDLLFILDNELQHLRSVYRAREGRELEILILSDHGEQPGGSGHPGDGSELSKAAGYRIKGPISGSRTSFCLLSASSPG